MQIETTRFGTVEVAAEDILEFDRGLFGFEDEHRYVLLRHAKGSPLRLLQSVDRPDLAFAVLEPFLFCPEYTVDLSESDAAAVDWWGDSSVMVLVIVGVTGNPDDMTANMKGPILIDPKSRRGLQIVQPGERWPAQMRVLDAIRERAGSRDSGSE